jgi:NTP pyrophosphatase (non-canonical NTP hydrolase)
MSNYFPEFQRHVARLFVKPDDSVGRMVHAALGFASEAGELASPIKAHWIYGRELDEENILEEAGDALFYLQALLTECGYTIDDAMAYNIQKLMKRYPQGYTDQAAIARADKE